MTDELMTGKQVAEYLNMSDKTVRKLVKTGHLKQFAIGSQMRRYRKSDVDDMIAKLSKRSVAK